MNARVMNGMEHMIGNIGEELFSFPVGYSLAQGTKSSIDSVGEQLLACGVVLLGMSQI